MSLKLLIIDDNHDTLDILELVLYNRFDISTAMNGFEGLKKAQQEMPDLIITDIMMPVMDGIRFFNSLKKESRLSHIPVIATTSFIRKINRDSLLNIGFNEVLSKPLDKQVLMDTIDAALNGTQTNNKPATESESNETQQ